MSPKNYYFLLFLIIGTVISCQDIDWPDGPSPTEDKIVLQGLYEGEASVQRITYRSNVGPDNIYSDTTFTFPVEIELEAADITTATYEAKKWDRCDEMPINVIGSPCPGNYITFNDAHSHCSSYSHDQLNALCIEGNPELNTLKVDYEYREIFVTEVMDNDGNLLYAEWKAYIYAFEGKR